MTKDSKWIKVDGMRILDLLLVVSKYPNGRWGMLAIDAETGEPDTVITVNLDDELSDSEFFVRRQTERYSPEIFSFFESNKIAERTGRVVSAGYVENYAEVWRLC